MEANTLKRLLFRFHLYDETKTTLDYLEIINDYMLTTREVIGILSKASEKNKETDFDYYRNILTELIKKGKDRSER